MKFVKILFIITLISTILTASGCKSDIKGQTINAFSERMNALNEDYKMSPLGYIYDSDKKTISKFYTTDKREILVQFSMNDNSEITSMNIVFDNLTQDNQNELDFIYDCIRAFVDNDSVTEELLSGIGFYTEIYVPANKTRNKKIGDVEILMDVTEAYTIITVEQNIP
jgi:hypothetical protein